MPVLFQEPGKLEAESAVEVPSYGAASQYIVSANQRGYQYLCLTCLTCLMRPRPVINLVSSDSD